MDREQASRQDDEQRLVRAVQVLTTSGREAALAELEQVRHGLLAPALRTYLANGAAADVYGSADAFTAFINGGGNVALYQATSQFLADLYRDLGPDDRLLDLGTGDGRALVPALQALEAASLPAVTAVEPSDRLSAVLSERLAALPRVRSRVLTLTAQELADADETFTLAQATFAMQSLPVPERAKVFSALRPRVRTLVLVEFDVPAGTSDEPSALVDLLRRYERGLSEYEGQDRDLVAQGFLMPVLVGELAPADTVRTNWNQPAQAWVDELSALGYVDVRVVPVADYWFSPCFALVAQATATASISTLSSG